MAVRAFAGSAGNDTEYPLQGNPCHVTALTAATASTPEPGTVTQCYTWLTAAGTAQVSCWTPGGMPIRLCGHGLLSCGTVWSHTDTPVQTLIMHDTEAQFERRDGTGWVGLAPLASSDCAVPQWTTTLFGSPPARAATAGQSDDYLILVWADDFPLRELALPANLAQHTQRAVIATCLNARQPGFDICFRYFAPQHGIAEDVATGSAMRVLATFWQQQLGDSLRAMQCSPQGGELLSRVEPGITWVGGNVLSHDSGSCA